MITKSRWLSFFFAISLSVNPWLLNFSRDPWENVFNSLFVNILLLGIILLKDYRLQKTGICILIAGVVLGFYGYHPGKLFIISLLFFFFVESPLLNSWKKHIAISTFVLLGFLLLILPQAIFTFKNLNKSFDRIQNVSIFKSEKPLEEVKLNIYRNTRFFLILDHTAFVNNYLNKRYLPLNYPIINNLLIPFYLIGIIISLRKHRYLLIIYLTLLFVPQLFSKETPDGARAIHTITLIYIFIFLGLTRVVSFTKKSKFVFMYIVILILLIGSIDVYTYFSWISNPTTLEARKPAVSINEFSLWHSTLEKNIKNGKAGFSVDEWGKMSKYPTVQ